MLITFKGLPKKDGKLHRDTQRQRQVHTETGRHTDEEAYMQRYIHRYTCVHKKLHIRMNSYIAKFMNRHKCIV